MSEAFEIVREKLGFTVPDSYRRMYASGLLGEDPERSLTLSDTEWLDPESVVKYDAERLRRIQLIPFAMTGRGDVWAWSLSWAAPQPDPDQVPVAYKMHDTNDMEGHSPHFIGCVYRLLLDEMYDTMLPQIRAITPEAVGEIHRRNARLAAPHLPAAWSATLDELSARPVRDTRKSVGVMDRAELLRILQRDLPFSHLNQSVVVE